MKNLARNIRTAFTIVELLVSLAITALLLAAVAVAFNASVMSYNENEKIFRAVNSSRQAITRITTQLRTASAVDPCAPVNECSMVTANGRDITYRYNNTDNKLYLITNDDLSDDDYILCDNVTAMSFVKDTQIAADPNNGLEVKSVRLSMTVSSGDIEKTAAAAVVIRRNLVH